MGIHSQLPLMESISDEEDEYEAISVWDQLAEELIRAGMVSGTSPRVSLQMLADLWHRGRPHGARSRVLASFFLQGSNARDGRGFRETRLRFPTRQRGLMEADSSANGTALWV